MYSTAKDPKQQAEETPKPDMVGFEFPQNENFVIVNVSPCVPVRL